jgi:hypothetical protein
MRYFRRRRPCEACGKVVGRTEKAVEITSRNATALGGLSLPIIIHQSCRDAAPKYTWEIPLVSHELPDKSS